MNNLDDVIDWFQSTTFIINPLITIIVKGGKYNAPRILAILIWFDKNDVKTNYNTVGSYINYLRS